MSRERLNQESLAPELSELESALGSLRANGTVNRDELLFEAGRRSGSADSRGGVWKAISVALAIMFVAQSVAYWPQASVTVTDHNVSEDAEYEIPTLVESTSPGVTHRVNSNDSPAKPMYLQIRRTALVDGIDSAYSQAADVQSNLSEPKINQRRLLKELLGS